MYEGIYTSAARGSDGTGIALVRHGEEKGIPPLIYKDAICPFDFLHRPLVNKSFLAIDDYSMVIGHTRSTTRGLATQPNTHPFQHKHITLVHNGTIENAYEFAIKSPLDIVVDSHKVCWALGELGEKEEEISILERLKGGYSLIWHNARNGTLNFARNEKKPLYFAYIEKENTMCWASEYNLLVYLMERRSMEIDTIAYYPRVNCWYKFPIHDLRLPLTQEGKEYVRPFVLQKSLYIPPYRGPADTTTSTKDTEKGTFEDKFVEPTKEELEQIQSEVFKFGDSFDPNKPESVKEWLRQHKTDALFQQRGVPTSFKKIQQAARDLMDFGFKFGQSTAMVPKEYRLYKAKKNNRVSSGDVIGETLSGKPVVITSVPPDTWRMWYHMHRVFIRTVNVKTLGDNKSLMVAVPHETQKIHEKTYQQRIRGRDNDKEELQAVRGPNNTKVSIERFRQLTSVGCAACSCDLRVEDAESITWAHECPLCKDCSEDHEVLVRCGLAMPYVH